MTAPTIAPLSHANSNSADIARREGTTWVRAPEIAALYGTGDGSAFWKAYARLALDTVEHGVSTYSLTSTNWVGERATVWRNLSSDAARADAMAFDVYQEALEKGPSPQAWARALQHPAAEAGLFDENVRSDPGSGHRPARAASFVIDLVMQGKGAAMQTLARLSVSELSILDQEVGRGQRLLGQSGAFESEEARTAVAWWVAGMLDLRQDVASELNARRAEAAKVLQPKVNTAQLQQPARGKLV